jgi:tetratricopeptide (TPR) repeat protein
VPSKTPYEVLADVGPRLLKRDADAHSVSLLGQTVSDVVDGAHRLGDASVLLKVIADLESARSNALVETINREWALPLAALLGLVRQHLHNRRAEAASMNPASETLRDKVQAAIDAGVETPTAIGSFVGSPPTVVSRTLRRLVQDGVIEQVDAACDDKRVRRYRRTRKDEAAASKRRSRPDAVIARTVLDPVMLVDFADRQSHINPVSAMHLIPDLMRIGVVEDAPAPLRVSALSVACVITRASGLPDAAEESLAIADTVQHIADQSGDTELLARATYERVRAGLLAVPAAAREYLDELETVEKYLQGIDGMEAVIRRGWCDYTRSIILDRTAMAAPSEHIFKAIEAFETAKHSYGLAASHNLLARTLYTSTDFDQALSAVRKAAEISNAHGYLRLMAEASFWMGEVLMRDNHVGAEYCFKTAGDQFKSVGGASTWSVLCSASARLAAAQSNSAELGRKDAKKLVGQFRKAWKSLGGSGAEKEPHAWAVALFSRRLGVIARHAGDWEIAEESFSRSISIYRSQAHLRGAVMAQAGLNATQHKHEVIDHDDAEAALQSSKQSTGREEADSAATSMLERATDHPRAELIAL